MEWDGDQQWFRRQDGAPLQMVEVVAASSPHPSPAAAATSVFVVSPPEAACVPLNDGLGAHAVASDRVSSSRQEPAPRNKPHAASKEAPVKKQSWFEFLPLQTSIKPLLRPKYPCSQKNVGSVDRQAAQEQAAADFRSARFMQQAATLSCHSHHHTLQLGGEGATPQEHIVPGDRGKGRPSWCRSSLIFDPITSTSRPVTAPGRTEPRAGLLSPSRKSSMRRAFPAADSSSASSSMRGHETLFFRGSVYHTLNGELVLQEQQHSRPGSAGGRYNPLTHTWLEAPPAAVLSKWEREADTGHTMLGRRPGSAAATVGSTSRRQTASSSADCAGKDTVGSLLRQDSISSSIRGSLSASSAQDTRIAGSRRRLQAGDTRGTYDCLRHQWVAPASEGSAGALRAQLASSESLRLQRKCATPPSTGVYDPIKGQWKVLPAQQRAAVGLDFAPRKLFEESAFVRR